MIRIEKPLDWLIPILIGLSLFTGLIKSLTGIRYFPLIIDIILITCLLILILTKIFSNRLKIGKIDIIAVLFIILAVLGIFNPNIPSFQTGVEGFRKFAFMISGFFLGRYLFNEFTLKRLHRILIICAFFISLYGIKQYLFPSNLDFRLIDLSTSSPVTYLMGGHIRAFSTLAGPFHLGIFLTSILLLLFVNYQYFPGRRFLILSCSIPPLIALIMTVTKSNWIALFIGIVFLIFLNSRNIFKLFLRLLFLGLGSIIIVLLLVQFTSSFPIFQTVYSGFQAVINPLEAPTLSFRFDLWKNTILPLILNSLWTGYGTGSAGEGLGNLFINEAAVYTNAHNIFLKIQFEKGLIGLVVFLIFIFSSLIQIFQVRRYLQNSFLRIISDWTLSFFVAIMVAGMVGSILDAYPINLLFWIMVGVSTKLNKLEPIDNSINLSESNQTRELQGEEI